MREGLKKKTHNSDSDDDLAALNTRIRSPDKTHKNASNEAGSSLSSSTPNSRTPLGLNNPNQNLQVNSNRSVLRKDRNKQQHLDENDEPLPRPLPPSKQTQRFRKRMRKHANYCTSTKPDRRSSQGSMYILDEDKFREMMEDSDSDIGTTDELPVFRKFYTEVNRCFSLPIVKTY